MEITKHIKAHIMAKIIFHFLVYWILFLVEINAVQQEILRPQQVQQPHGSLSNIRGSVHHPLALGQFIIDGGGVCQKLT